MMKKKLISFLLTIVQIIVDLNIVVMGMGAFMGIIFLLAAPFTGVGHEFFDYQSGLGLTIQVLDVVAEGVIMIIGLLGTRNLLSNINDGLYFVNKNMLAVRQILYAGLFALILGSINTVAFNMLHIQDKLNIFTFSGNDLSNSLSFLIVIFLIYLIFKRGVALQKEADEII